jgi:NAD(P)-dependent dehydrogenase (short-subunit alcohol dehydrogenase family)
MKEMFNLKGKVAIVTGGNGGIGKGIARGFAGAGSEIVIAARNQSKTAETAREIQEESKVRVLGVQVDVREESQIRGMVQQALDLFGRIDILVNNAGTNIRKNPQVNALLPGWINTDLTRNARKIWPNLDERVLARTPAGRWGEPKDLAGAAIFLAGPASDFITGVALPVDGGFSVMW